MPCSSQYDKAEGNGMKSRLSPAEFVAGRWSDEREREWSDLDRQYREPLDQEPSVQDPPYPEPSLEPPLHPSEVERLEHERRPAGDGKRNAWRVALTRFVAIFCIFCIGVAATLAWQSFANPARQATPAVATVPPAPESSTPGPAASASQLATISRSLAAMRQSVDKLAADITRLQAVTQDPGAATAPGRKPTRAAPAQ
jgi:hypothetical protein